MNSFFSSEPQCKVAGRRILSFAIVAEIKGRHKRAETAIQIARAMGLLESDVAAALTEEQYSHIPAMDAGLLPQPDVSFADPRRVLLKRSVIGLNDALISLGLI